MTTNFNQYENIYWVFTQLCNDKCAHCYNNSGPQGERMSEEECMAIIDNLPEQLHTLILSGGEPLAELKLLYAILDRVEEKYNGKLIVTLQFNGDLLKPEILQMLIAKGVNSFSIASIDRYHKKQGDRKDELIALFESAGLKPAISFLDYEAKKAAELTAGTDVRTYGFFGATEDMWLGGNWPRGRSMKNDIWKKDGTHNFCSILSGAKGFIDTENESQLQQLSIQLWKINPCCPGTRAPMGDARIEKVADVVERMTKSEIMQKLNKGDAYGMGESIGISAEEGLKRAIELGSVCLWCDEFFKKHYDMKTQAAKNVELVVPTL